MIPTAIKQFFVRMGLNPSPTPTELRHKVRPVVGEDNGRHLHRALNLLVDSAIAADDATSERDIDGLAIAMTTLQRHANSALGLYRAWGLDHA